MKGILETASPVPTTPLSDRLRQRQQTTQTLLVYFLNIDMKSQKLSKLGRSLGFKVALSHTHQVTHVVVKLSESTHAIKEEYPTIYSAVLLGQFIADHKCKSIIHSQLDDILLLNLYVNRDRSKRIKWPSGGSCSLRVGF